MTIHTLELRSELARWVDTRLGHDTSPEDREIGRRMLALTKAESAPSSAVPLETMIEEMEQVEIWFDGVWWTRTGSKDAIARSGHSVYAAVSALYAAWRERRNDG